MTQTITDYAKRPLRAAEVDGLNEVLGGIILLAITMMQYTSTFFQATIRGSNFTETPAFRTTLALWIAAIIAMFAIIYLTKRGVKALRERYVYPRIGYVAPRVAQEKRRKWIGVAVALGTLLFTSMVAWIFPKSYSTLPIWNSGVLVVLLGIFGAVGYFVHFAKLGFARHLGLGGMALSASLLLAMLHLDDIPAIYLWTVILGVSMIIGGALAFARLLKVPAFTEDDAE